ncbi:MerR family transcriptional regulator [Streptomyces sp. NPDC001941]|uniref:MerR family transcriptional regulator n=1 Tax=Streptomyces sp. NPDC001941 TaxID=3154659 RepID=UPI0033304F83
MRIGEIAALVGVTSRAVRHYHHLGLLPEPERRANGYRDYSTRDAVLLARIRRLTELGLGLDEVRDVLADDEGRELVDVLEELDADLARQEERIRERRARLDGLLRQARDGRLPAEGPVSPELAALFADLRDGPVSPMAARDRELLTLLDTIAPAGERERLIGAMRAVTADPELAARTHEVYALLDALEGAAAGDPRVDGAARALAACLPEELLPGPGEWDPAALDPFLSDFSPAQAAAVRGAMRIAAERGRDR